MKPIKTRQYLSPKRDFEVLIQKSLFVMRFLTLYRLRPVLTDNASNNFSFSKAVALQIFEKKQEDAGAESQKFSATSFASFVNKRRSPSDGEDKENTLNIITDEPEYDEIEEEEDFFCTDTFDSDIVFEYLEQIQESELFALLSPAQCNYFSFSKYVALEDLAKMQEGRGIVAECSSDTALDTWASPSIMPRRHRGDITKESLFVMRFYRQRKAIPFFLIKKGEKIKAWTIQAKAQLKSLNISESFRFAILFRPVIDGISHRFLTLYRPRPLSLVCAESKEKRNFQTFSKAVALQTFEKKQEDAETESQKFSATSFASFVNKRRSPSDGEDKKNTLNCATDEPEYDEIEEEEDFFCTDTFDNDIVFEYLEQIQESESFTLLSLAQGNYFSFSKAVALQIFEKKQEDAEAKSQKFSAMSFASFVNKRRSPSDGEDKENTLNIITDEPEYDEIEEEEDFFCTDTFDNDTFFEDSEQLRKVTNKFAVEAYDLNEEEETLFISNTLFNEMLQERFAADTSALLQAIDKLNSASKAKANNPFININSKEKSKSFKLKLKLFSILFLTILFQLFSYAQKPQETGANGYTVKPLMIGDTIPESLWNLPLQVVNHPEEKNVVSLNEYRGKAILINFISTGCASCIKALPKFKEYQNQFDSRIVFLPIFSEGVSRVDNFLKFNEYTRQADFPAVVEDKLLHAYFPHRYISHIVWVDESGTVNGFTGSNFVEPRTIEDFLEAKYHNWPIKSESTSFFSKPIVSLPFVKDIETLRNRHLLDKWLWISGHIQGIGLLENPNEGLPLDYRWISYRNKQPIDLIKIGLKAAATVDVDYKGVDPLKFTFATSDRRSQNLEEWMRLHAVCYERPWSEKYSNIDWRNRMLKDLSNYYNIVVSMVTVGNKPRITIQNIVKENP